MNKIQMEFVLVGLEIGNIVMWAVYAVKFLPAMAVSILWLFALILSLFSLENMMFERKHEK